LRQAGVRVEDANAAAFALAAAFDVERPPVGLELRLRTERPDGQDALRLIGLEVEQQGREVLQLTRAADESWRLNRQSELDKPAAGGPVREQATLLAGPMEQVLYGDPAVADDAPLILQASRLFARKLDLTRDLALGDEVRIMLTRRIGADGRVVGAGSLLFAEILPRSGAVRIYRHQKAPGSGFEYVDEDGLALDRALLRTPLDRPRVTSGFGMRMHPLLGFSRMHEGIDLGASVGTAVLAAGDGVVEAADWAGGYGRRIKLRHPDGFETVYAHLSAWGPGVVRGARVQQGGVIGYVGATGLVTGPHLHYEVWAAGRPVDPRGQAQTGGRLLEGPERVAFDVEKRNLSGQLDRLAAQNVMRTGQASAIPRG
jgi:murein DD-endopeptidase MepM/ murein hydrolase activator NlpD